MSNITDEQREGMRRILLQVIRRYLIDVRAQTDGQYRDCAYGMALGNIMAGDRLGLFTSIESTRLYSLAFSAMTYSREDVRHA